MTLFSETPFILWLDSIKKQHSFHRRIHSDPIYPFKNKPTDPFDRTSSFSNLEIKTNQEENLSNISYSIAYGSRESFLSIEQSLPSETNRPSVSSQMTLIDTGEKQFDQSIQSMIPLETISNSSSTRLPYSSLFWPRKGQTLDNYIRECDSQTRTDVEKVDEFINVRKNIVSFF